MNAWVRRGLRTALLAGGLLAAGTGVAAADENDVAAEAAGAIATVPVADGAVLDVPLLAGTGGDLDVAGLLEVREATASPDPDGDLAATVPVHTAGADRGTATTVSTPLVRGDATGPRQDAVVLPVSAEAGAPTTVTLPDRPGDGEEHREQLLLLPLDLLPGFGEDDLPGTTVDLDLADLLGSDGGAVIGVPVNEGHDGRPGDGLVRVTLPFPGHGHGDGSGPGHGPSPVPGHAPGSGSGTGTDGGDRAPRSPGSPGAGARTHGGGLLCTDPVGVPAAPSGAPAGGAVPATGPSGGGTGGTRGDACGIGTASAGRPAPASERSPSGLPAAVGLLVLGAVLVLATAGRGQRARRG
ncbi:hypothetical protein [Geodermatophilus sp. SYSU D00815]